MNYAHIRHHGMRFNLAFDPWLFEPSEMRALFGRVNAHIKRLSPMETETLHRWAKRDPIGQADEAHGMSLAEAVRQGYPDDEVTLRA